MIGYDKNLFCQLRNLHEMLRSTVGYLIACYGNLDFNFKPDSQHAKQMLNNGIPIVQVVSNTGFVDQSHFTRVFKKMVGM